MSILLKKLLRIALLASLVGATACATAPHVADYSYIPGKTAAADDLTIADF